MPQDYYPTGPFLGQLPDAGDFDIWREDFLLGFAERTARAYKADLEDYREWCVQEGVDLLSPSAAEVETYLRLVADRGYSTGTVGRRAAAVRGFLARLGRQRTSESREAKWR